MTLEELEKQIQEKENELKELKKRRLLMTGKAERIFSVTSLRSMFIHRGFMDMYNPNDADNGPNKYKKMAILEVSGGRTDNLNELTFEEFSKVNDAFLRLAKEELDKLDKEREIKEKEELERKREYEEKYKDLLELDEMINKVWQKMFEFDFHNDEETDWNSIKETLETKRKELMKLKNVKEVGFPVHYEPA